jgi:divalent metal cation (Fe/Co/Zn/Cd) transporter
MTNDHTQRALQVRTAIRLEYFTILYNLAEGVASIAFGGVANSIALIGFGVDSFVESLSGIFVLRRFRSEVRGGADDKTLESRAIRYVGWSFILLAAYIGFESIRKLWLHEIPDASIGGIIIAVLSLVIMPLLALRKRKTGIELQSGAMIADSKETIACSLLSAELLIGLSLNAWLGWWWADPVSGLAMIPWLLIEARESFETDSDDVD